MTRLKLPFELEKPSSNEYVTQAENIGYGNSNVKEELNKINLKGELLDFFKECDEQGFYIVDENGYINTAISSSKFDTSDIGTALTTIITSLIAEYAPTPTSEFLEVEEAGFYIVDSSYRIGAYLNSTGIPYGFAQHDYAYSVIGTSDYDVA